MAKTKISEFSATPANNTDIDSINISEGCAPSGINDAIRELMSQLKDWQAGTSNDPMVIGSSGSLTLNQGTANGVAYLNGSKVVTSGSALVFDGTNLGIGTSSPVATVDSVANSSSFGLSIRGRSADDIGSIGFYTNNGATNTAQIQMRPNDNEFRFLAAGSRSQTFYTNGSERMRLDSSGNLGLGVTPSAWRSGAFSYDVARSSYADENGTLTIASNAYRATSNWLYKVSTFATRMDSDSGQFRWYTAPSGTAGNAITFTQAMTLDASGNLGVGTTSPASRIDVNGKITFRNGGDSRLGYIQNTGGAMFIGSETSGTAEIVFQTNGPTERARIDSSGNLLVGTTSVSQTARLTLRAGTGVAFGVGPLDTSQNNFFVVNSSGTGVYLANGATSWTANSDERLKDIIEPISDAVAKVGTLRAVIGKYKADEEGTRRAFLIAQDVRAVLPEAVNTQDDEQGTLGVQYTDTIPLLVAAIKEQQALITALTARVAALESN